MKECILCMKKSNNIDLDTHICDDCTKFILDTYEELYNSLPFGYLPPCNYLNDIYSLCDGCDWNNEPYCAYKIISTIKDYEIKQQGN